MKKILKILTDNHPILRKKSINISKKAITTPEMDDLIDSMIITMKQNDGIGLAAPQIGKNIRLIVISTKEGSLAFLNPEIIKRSFLKEIDQEGCLSVPNTFGNVKRCKKITCKYLDEDCEEVEIEAEGLLARVIQHEIDHLNGILFTDKAKKIVTIKDENKKQKIAD